MNEQCIQVNNFTKSFSGRKVINDLSFEVNKGGAFTVFWDVTLLTPGNRFNLLLIFVLKVRDEELPVPLILVKSDTWEFIGLEFLIFWGVGIIKSPLLERDIFADKIN